MIDLVKPSRFGERHRFVTSRRVLRGPMNKKYAQDYRRRKREEAAAQISMLDKEMLELARRLRHCTHASFLGAGPRAQALQALQKAIDKVSAW